MKISNLHFITALPEHAEQACRGGVRWVQLRVKNASAVEWRRVALETQAVCQQYGATLIINDNPPLAREIGAAGVHLGRQDMAPAEARALLGPGPIIGGTANTFADIEHLVGAGVDYIGLGPFRFTTTKPNLSPILGFEGYTAILKQCRAANLRVPVVGIGGITLPDVVALRSIGLHGIAVSGALSGVQDIAGTTARFIEHLQELASLDLVV